MAVRDELKGRHPPFTIRLAPWAAATVGMNLGFHVVPAGPKAAAWLATQRRMGSGPARNNQVGSAVNVSL
jgi:hypothetical protein